MIKRDFVIHYADRRNLAPRSAGIYIVFNSFECLYVGRSSCLKNRLYSHTNKNKFLNLSAHLIRIIECEDGDCAGYSNHLSELEKHFINFYKPKLNYVPIAQRANI